MLWVEDWNYCRQNFALTYNGEKTNRIYNKDAYYVEEDRTTYFITFGLFLTNENLWEGLTFPVFVPELKIEEACRLAQTRRFNLNDVESCPLCISRQAIIHGTEDNDDEEDRVIIRNIEGMRHKQKQVNHSVIVTSNTRRE